MQLVELYRCLSDETQLRLLHLLARAPLCVCHLQSILGLDQVAVSKHLAYLRERGLVDGRRHQQWMIYSLPVQRPLELDLQLRCLQECAANNEILRDDLQRFERRESECCWVPGVLAELAPDEWKAVRSCSTKPRKDKSQLVPQYA